MASRRTSTGRLQSKPLLRRRDVRRPLLARSDFLTENSSRRLDWLGTTRGRVGFAVTPDNRLMIYGTGGVAYGGGSRHFEVFDNDDGWDWNGGGGSSTRVGWTIGAGVEYAFTDNHAEGRISVLRPRQLALLIISNPPPSRIFSEHLRSRQRSTSTVRSPA